VNRVHDQQIAEAVGEALRWIPRRLRPALESADFLIGVDPVFAGLHDTVDVADGRSYRTTAHVHYPKQSWHTNPVVVLPDEDDRNPHVVAHELGHVLEVRLRAIHAPMPGPWMPTCAYAARNYAETFACAFHSWLMSSRFADEAMNGWGGYDPKSRAFFDELVVA
jgi:hypothetical protein